MAIVQQHLTLEEFLKLPEEKPALEFEDGLVSQKVSPKGQHSTLQWSICNLLNRLTIERRSAMAFPELRSTYGGHSYVPDVSVYTWDRIPRTADGKVANDFFEPPDIAIEIVSPEQSVNRLIKRCLWYLEHGVRIALLVDPQDESVLLFRPGTGPVPLSGSDRIALDDVLPGFELTVEALFATLKIG